MNEELLTEVEVDPSANPRFLGGEEIEPGPERALELRERLAEIRERQEVYARPGWRLLTTELESKVNEAIRVLVEGELRDMAHVAEFRGAIKSLRFVLSFEERDRTEAEAAREELERMEEREEEEP